MAYVLVQKSTGSSETVPKLFSVPILNYLCCFPRLCLLLKISLHRCIGAHERPDEQSLFPIIQGGLDHELRKVCLKEMIARDQPGYAIGGLSGGEEKDQFWKIVSLCTDYLPVSVKLYFEM